MTHVYHWLKWNPALKGRRCKVLARGTKNSVLVEFEDGYKAVVSRYALRKIKPAPPQ